VKPTRQQILARIKKLTKAKGGTFNFGGRMLVTEAGTLKSTFITPSDDVHGTLAHFEEDCGAETPLPHLWINEFSRTDMEDILSHMEKAPSDVARRAGRN
jgi:hypothetical protein